MDINIVAVLIASVAQFIISAIWYMPLFGKKWGELHDFEAHSPEEQAVMTKQMMPLLAVQFIVTVLTSAALAVLMTWVPATLSVYVLAALLWIGFVVPTQVGAVMFGGTKPERIVPKLLIMAGISLINLEVAAAIIKMMM